MTPYQQLVRLSRERALVASCSEVLGWDELTYMPPGGVEHRGHQMAYLAGVEHSLATDPRVADWLDEAAEAPPAADPTSAVAVNLRRWRRQHERLTRIPRKLIEEIAEVTAFAQNAWHDACQENEYRVFAPWLQKIVTLKQHEIRCHGDAEHPYDLLLDEYEINATTAQVATMFENLRQELTLLLQAIGDSSRLTSPAILHREFPVERQKIFAETIASDIGYDFRRGRIDATTHPFYAAIGPGDCRITTRYNARDFGDAFFSMLHELGHGLYEQGLDPEHYGTPFGEAPSTGVHESQSQLWEKMVGRLPAFWQYIFPRVREMFHDSLHHVSWRQFYEAVNHVEPSSNRVRADTVTYDLHILIRFELEQRLIDGSLLVDDLPLAWNDAYRRHLGVTPEDDLQGCLQDGHWSAAMFGYFPVYTLGNLYAAQFFAAAREALGDLDRAIARGDFRDLLDWLTRHIFAQGGAADPAQLVERVTGRAPDYHDLVRLLWSRYEEIYQL